jgi:hypothetical protein
VEYNRNIDHNGSSNSNSNAANYIFYILIETIVSGTKLTGIKLDLGHYLYGEFSEYLILVFNTGII